MGREIEATIRWQGLAAEGRAILEGAELVLRGAIRAKVPRDRIIGQVYEAGTLLIRTTDGPLEIDMDEREGAAWLRALAKPPPDLAQKLGIGPAAPAFVLGPDDDPALAAALAGARADRIGDAMLLIAVLIDEAAIGPAVALAQSRGLALWCLYPKGKTATPSDGVVRAALRAAGFIDTKSCAVSDDLTATRYKLRG